MPMTVTLKFIVVDCFQHLSDFLIECRLQPSYSLAVPRSEFFALFFIHNKIDTHLLGNCLIQRLLKRLRKSVGIVGPDSARPTVLH